MSKYKTMLKKDIQLCDEYISKNFATHDEVKSLTGKYIMDYPKFNEGIIAYVGVPGYETNEIENIKIVKSGNTIHGAQIYDAKTKTYENVPLTYFTNMSAFAYAVEGMRNYQSIKKKTVKYRCYRAWSRNCSCVCR